MPTATIQTPDGRIVTIEVPEGATEQQILEFVQSQDLSQFQPQQTQLPEGTTLGGVGETAQALGQGLVGAVSGGLQGLGVLAQGTPEEAAERVGRVQQQYTYIPETQAGQETLQAVQDFGGLVDRIVATGIGFTPTLIASAIEGTDLEQDLKNLYESGTEGIADRIFSETDSPTAGTAAILLPEVMASITGRVRIRPGINELAANVSPRKMNQVLKQGMDERVANMVGSASDVDKNVMRNMMDIFKKGKEDIVFQQRNRPTDAVGDQLVKRIKHVQEQNQFAGSQIDAVAEGLKGKQVDFLTPFSRFTRDLESELGIRFDDAGNPNFEGSLIDELQGDQALINKIINRAKKVRVTDALEMHNFKRFIDSQVSFGQKSEGGIQAADRIAKSLRRNIDQTLDNQFPLYDKANAKFKETRDALDAIQDAAGTKLDFDSPSASQQTGVLLRRLLGNAQSRGRLFDSIDEIDRAAKNTGGRFDDDIVKQMVFADELDRMFGTTANTSLGGELKRATERASQGQPGLFAAFVDQIGDRIENLRGINDENAIKAIEDLINGTNN